MAAEVRKTGECPAEMASFLIGYSQLCDLGYFITGQDLALRFSDLQPVLTLTEPGEPSSHNANSLIQL